LDGNTDLSKEYQGGGGKKPKGKRVKGKPLQDMKERGLDYALKTEGQGETNIRARGFLESPWLGTREKYVNRGGC